MGTRAAYGFHRDGQDKVTYNQFDGYPEGLGTAVVQFVRDTPVERMNEIFDQIELVDEERDVPTAEQIKECMPYFDGEVSTGRVTDWYCLLRETQGDLTPYRDAGLKYMIDSRGFLKDSLFCEWAYVVNLTTGMLEVYRGFQKAPQPNRYRIEAPIRVAGVSYYNVGLLVEFPLDAIPDDWLQIVEDLAQKQDVDDEE